MRVYMKAYHSLLTDLQSLSDEEFGIFMRGCLRYSETGEIPVFGDRLLDALFITQKRLIDEADAEYECIREKNRENIMKRWHSEQIPNDTTVYDRIRPYTNDTKTKTKTKTKTIPSKEGNKHFVPPTVDEVAEYCEERGNCIDAERFVAFYQQKGWMVGKNKMVDWKAAVRNWEQRDKAEHPKTDTQYKNAELEKLEVDLLGGDFSW